MSNVKEVEKELINRLPLRSLHNLFGVCFDKKDTYTMQQVPLENIKGSITISSILKAIGVKDNDKDTIIVFTYLNKYYYWNEESKKEIEYFNITTNNSGAKVVSSYGGDLYKKTDILPKLKEAVEIVVIRAKWNSLNFPKNNNERDKDFYRSRDFNDNGSLYERVKFVDNYGYRWNVGTNETERILLTDNEVRATDISTDITVEFIGTGERINLSMTWGCKKGETWGECIDKSGYSRKAALMDLYFRLQKFKADKIRKQAKEGNFEQDQSQILDLLFSYKNEMSEFIKRTDFENLKKVTNYIYSFNSLKSDYDSLSECINNIGTDKEYIGYTLRIKDNIEQIKNEVNQKIKELQIMY